MIKYLILQPIFHFFSGLYRVARYLAFNIFCKMFDSLLKKSTVPETETWAAYNRFTDGMFASKLTGGSQYTPFKYTHYTKFDNNLITFHKKAYIASYVAVELCISFKITDISELDQSGIHGTVAIQDQLYLRYREMVNYYVRKCTAVSSIYIGKRCNNDVAPNDTIHALTENNLKFNQRALNDINYKGVEISSLNYKIISQQEDFDHLEIKPEEKWVKAKSV